MSRPLDGVLERLAGYVAEKRRGSFASMVAIDLPTGLDADTGKFIGHAEDDDVVDEMREFGYSYNGFRAFTADLTVTFHRAKYGHQRGHGPWACGQVVVKDIGL